MRKNYQSIWMKINKKLKRLSYTEKKRLTNEIQSVDCVLLDTPVHGNIGDHAIVEAQKQLFNELGVKAVEIPAVELAWREKAFADIIPKEKTVFAHGGGFLGSLWPEEEKEFRRIIQAFRNHRIVVFPQTITFDMDSEEGRSFFKDSYEIYSSHKSITIFARDERTRKFMEDNMPDVNCILVPDVVTQFRVKKNDGPRSGILLCFRNDVEKALPDSFRNELTEYIKQQYPQETIVCTDTVIDDFIYPDERKNVVEQKLMQFSSSKLVVTDRLHGMIFSAITNTPCICFDNKNGKVSAQYEWIRNNSYVKLVDGLDGFCDVLRSFDIDRDYQYDRTNVMDKIAPLTECIKNVKKYGILR